MGRQAKMPWQVDGPHWHLRDRVGRKGEPCRWDGRILEEVVDRIHALGTFRETNWNSRTIVEITGMTKSHGWFFHAITGETWLLKMKFRTTKGSFRREQIVRQLELKTLNEMHDLPIYGNAPRVRCKTLRGPWQEIELRVHTWEEIDKPAFWEFLEKAVQGFQNYAKRAATNPEELMPWKQLGVHWHMSRRGFPLGKSGCLETRLARPTVSTARGCRRTPGRLPVAESADREHQCRESATAVGNSVHEATRFP